MFAFIFRYYPKEHEIVVIPLKFQCLKVFHCRNITIHIPQSLCNGIPPWFDLQNNKITSFGITSLLPPVYKRILTHMLYFTLLEFYVYAQHIAFVYYFFTFELCILLCENFHAFHPKWSTVVAGLGIRLEILNEFSLISTARKSVEMSIGAELFEAVLRVNALNGTDFCMNYINNSMQHEDTDAGAPPTALEVWGIGLLMVSIISFSAIIGVLLMPFLKPAMYERVLKFFVGLGTGTLSGTAIFGLIPEAFDLHVYFPDHLDKSLVIICGIYLFYFIDKAINLGCTWNERRKEAREPQDMKTKTETIQSLRELEDQKAANNKDDHIESVAWLVIFGDAVHNFIDGLSIGAAFNESVLTGLGVAFAILCEELPHELGDCAILVSSGFSRKKALMYNLLSASTCYIGFVIGVIVGQISRLFGQMIFALAAGMFLYISLCGMLSKINMDFEERMKTDLQGALKSLTLNSAGILTGLLIIFVFSKYAAFLAVL